MEIDQTGNSTNEEPVIENSEVEGTVETAAEEGTTAEHPVPESIIAPEKPRRSWFSSTMHYLFSKDTAVGRFMRPLLRWTAFVVVLFSAGLLTMYFLRVRPTEQLWAQTAAQLMTTRAELENAQEFVTTSQSEVSDMQTRVQTAEATARTASQHLLLTTLRNDIATARVALIADKDVAAAILNISAAELDLQALAPAIDDVNATLAIELQDDLAAIKKKLNARPVNQATLANELFSFDVKLLGLETLMFPEKK
ncbi:hypothetical protein FDZ74_02705 [bacterium]|nr:MAG: hypothetical protein FDZ74_02705 [bacterium]